MKKILNKDPIVGQIVEIGKDLERVEADKPLIKRVTKDVENMPDREEMVAELKAKVESGEYNPTGDEIADAMIRRNIADHVR
ncbi:MAG: flagellar biosynthesis anti-sigma factor FlgM [Fimbriimonas ginsengisoli]|uniref:Flagellar biosynthesis anti-sigma factor FlgM n=1 Tax=Fimbriimonas ginsengisoli TaxID=1005039 RepID=A0A931LYJ2_FIMGI|nr:flagellar biosynthesis anti-sigma factor FlgM [Fimbriimonas ginsengisoli]MBI3721206.1 flagellar biosynthesis anti-sigma factor FlgM [Fimbriimonas ginsengisoli]